MKIVLHRLIAAILAVILWPHLVVGLGKFNEFLNEDPSYQGPDDFWPAVWFIRFLGACSIILSWIVRWATNKFQFRHVNLTSYMLVYFSFVTVFFYGEKYSDFESAISAINGGFISLSFVLIYDLICRFSVRVVRGFRGG